MAKRNLQTVKLGRRKKTAPAQKGEKPLSRYAAKNPRPSREEGAPQ